MTNGTEPLNCSDLPLFGAEDFRAKTSQWLGPALDWLESGQGCGMCSEELLRSFDRLGLSSKMSPACYPQTGGGDFAVVLSGLEKLGYRWAYRVLDAQYFGVAQRRERVFVVASLGDYRCAEVLFERDSVCGNPPPSREARQGVARPLAACPAGGSGYRNDADTADNLIPETVGALTDGAHRGGGSTARTPTADAYLPSVAWALQERDAKGADSSTKEGHLIPMPRGGFFDDGVADPISTNEAWTQSHAGNNPRPRNVVAVAFSGRMRGAEPAVGRLERPPHTMTEMTGALESVKPWNVASYAGVRRLTPTECERLQGVPDGWTAGFSDSVRYRMLGNAVAEPCANWIARRLVAVERGGVML